MRKLDKPYWEEEKPLIEFPTLVLWAIAFFSLSLGFMLLIFPWYIGLGFFIVLCLTIGVFLNPYVGVLIFLVGSLLHPTQFIGEAVAGFHLARNLAFLMLLTWLFHIIIYRDFKIVKAPQNFFVFGLGIMMFISTFRYFDYSSPHFLELLKLLILYFMVVNLVKSEKQLHVIIWFLIGLALFATFVGIYQYTHNIGMYSAEDGILRITGTALDPNDFAMHLVILIPLTFALFLSYKSIFIKIILAFLFILSILNIIFTFSRGGFVGLAVVLGLSTLVMIVQKKIKIAFIIFGLIVALVISLFVSQEYWQRIGSIVNVREASIAARLESWKAGLKMMKDHPFKGVGLGVFQYEYSSISQTDPGYKVKVPKYAHNSYIQVGAETGILGLLFFLGLIYFTFRDLFIASKFFKEQQRINFFNLSQFLIISLAGYVVCGMFLTQAFLTMFWIISPLAIVLKKFTEPTGRVL